MAAGPLNAQRVARAPLLVKPPVVDGIMQPGEWDVAARYSNLVQTEPTEGAPLTERTEVWLARDASNLYLAFVAFDAEMTKVRADLTPRDRATSTSDLVGVLLDPQHSGTRGYFFLFNPLGVQTDGVWTRSPDIGWDGVLESRGRVASDRYVVEVAIPLATLLSAGQSRTEWSINFFRQIPRKGEEGWWSPVPRDGTQNTPLHAGQLADMGDVHVSARLEVIPTAVAQASHNPSSDRGVAKTWGATTRFAISPLVRAEATYRPDFSMVESDDAQINYNERYALYYPEKRPFFLEAEDRFETPAASTVSEPLRLVHTRTIARPRFGARLLAEPEGGFVGGVFAAEETPDGDTDGTTGIVRGQLVRAGGTQAGLLLTHRARAGHVNTVVAADALVRLPANVVLTAQAARSSTTADANTATGVAGYVDISREGRSSYQQIVYRKVEPSFETDVGFIARTDLQQVVSHTGVYIRPGRGGLLAILPMMQHAISFDDAGRRTDVEYLPHVSFKFTRQTSVWLGERFGDEVYRGKTHAQGRFEMNVSTLPKPWLNLSAGAKLGRHIRYDDSTAQDATFTAAFREARAAAELRIGKAATISATGMWRQLGGNDVLPARELWLARARAAYQFTPTTYVRVIAQYDPDLARTDASVLLGHELSYGTQFHLGLDSGGAEAAADNGGARYHVFGRVSYLFRR